MRIGFRKSYDYNYFFHKFSKILVTLWDGKKLWFVGLSQDVYT